MRRIVNPNEGQPQIEDIQISFFESDKDENTAVRREIIEIPANCGRWAKEAMILGFFEYFDKIVSPEDQSDAARTKRIEEARANLERFASLVGGARAKLKPVEEAQPQPAP